MNLTEDIDFREPIADCSSPTTSATSGLESLDDEGESGESAGLLWPPFVDTVFPIEVITHLNLD